jgi:transcriptional regulator with XRE-family HTH domain
MLAVNPEAIKLLRHKISPDVATIATNDELAQRIGVSESTVSRVVSGKAEPGKKFLEGVLKNLGPDWFLAIIKVTDG